MHQDSKLILPARSLATTSPPDFECICEETLESICEKFEQLNELEMCPPDFDVTYAYGVLTVCIGGG